MELKFGSTGIAVNDLQRRLFYFGCKVPINGFFDKKTLETIKTIQKRFGLVVSGIYDYRVNEVLSDRSAAFFLKEKELLELAKKHKLQPALVAALVDTYSVKDFDEKHKLQLVFKRDVFYSLLKKAKYNVSVLSKSHPNIIHSERGGYLGGQAEKLRLTKASAINQDLAAMSVNYGMFEIPGTAYQSCGFESIHDFVKTMRTSEKNQVDVFLTYLDSNQLLDKLRELKFVDFAKAYDESYFHHFTDVALARTYEFYLNTYPLVDLNKDIKDEDAKTD